MNYNKILISIIFIIFTSCFGFLLISIDFISENPNIDEEQNIIVTGIKGTGSMLPSMVPSSQLQKVKFNGTRLLAGHIYVYEKENSTSTIVHRFVYETNDGLLYFKGDNNKVYDKPITIDKIKYEVIGYFFE